MENQQSNIKRKNLWWLLLPFLIVGALILITRIPFGIKKEALPFAGEANSELSSKFSPELLASLANKFDVNYIAGEFINMGFDKYTDNIILDGNVYSNQYSYYSGSVEEHYRIEQMQERCTTIESLNDLLYTIKNKGDYELFCNYLKSHSFDNIKDENKKGNYPHYIYNNAVFIDRNYLIDLDGYCFEIYPLSAFNNAASSNTTNTVVQNTTPEQSAEYASKTNEYRTNLKGLWHGNYGEGNIKFAFVRFDGDSAFGCSSVKENYAQFNGIISASSSGYNIEMNEPEGSSMGVFKLSYNSSDNEISGTWTSYDNTLSRDLNLSPAKKGDKMKVISEKAIIYSEPAITAKTEQYLSAGDEIEYLDFNEAYIKFRYTNTSGQETIGWLLIRRAAFE